MLIRKGAADRRPPDQATGRSCRNSGISSGDAKERKLRHCLMLFHWHSHWQETEITHRDLFADRDLRSLPNSRKYPRNPSST